MTKTILLTGASDGIGLETAKRLASLDHTLLIHGRNVEKLSNTKQALLAINHTATVHVYQADLSALDSVLMLANEIKRDIGKLDVVINNAGVFKTPHPLTAKELDARFMVNTISPYMLTQQLLPLMSAHSRIINLASAAQAPVDLQALKGKRRLSDSDAYAQSKLAIIMWTMHLAKLFGQEGPRVIAVNPASFLGSNMVKEAYGMSGKDVGIGADIIIRAGLSEEFSGITGRYFDNDLGDWSLPHQDALNEQLNKSLVKALDDLVRQV